MANGFLGNFNPDALLAISTGLLSGRNPQEQLGNAALGFAQQRKDARQRNVTMDWLKKNSPDLLPMLDAGMSPGELVNAAYKRQQDQLKAQAPSRKFQTLPNGDYGYFDDNAGTWTPLGAAPKDDKPDAYEERRKAAESNGLTPDNPAYQSYVLTGRMPREDQAPLTATDKKAILEADEMVQSNRTAVQTLKSIIDGEEGKSLNDRAGSGFGARMQAWAARNDPTGFFDDATGEATTELDNTVTGNTLGQLKSIFGGNPTEGERAVLRDLEAGVDKTPRERKAILDRAIALAEARLQFNQQRADELRGGTYYKPGGSSGGRNVDDLLKKYGGQ